MIGSTIFYDKKRTSIAPKLNLVALMDIFTILVFFLLLNSGESQKIENAKFINLPDSTAGITPHNELLILIDDDQIWIGNEPVAKVEDVIKTPDQPIESLAQALSAHKATLELSDYEKHNGLPVTILGNKDVSFKLLKSVMATCQKSDFREISLAVNQVISNTPQAAGVASDQAVNTSGKTGG